MRRGFTLVETMFVVVIGSLLLTAFQTMSSQGVRSSVKGMDLVESIRSANEVFAQIRKDLRGSTRIITGMPDLVVPVGASVIDESGIRYATSFQFAQGMATITYSLVPGASGTGYIHREFLKGGTTEKKNFAVPKIRLFRVARIRQQQRIGKPETGAGGGFPIFLQDQFLVQVEVETSDPRFPTRLSSVFVSGQMEETGWVGPGEKTVLENP